MHLYSSLITFQLPSLQVSSLTMETFLEEALTRALILESSPLESPGIIDQYSLNDYLMVHTSNQTNVTNGNIELCHDYSPEVLLFSAINGIVHPFSIDLNCHSCPVRLWVELCPPSQFIC